jgi:PhnB protein
MTNKSRKSTNEVLIREIVEGWAKAIRAQDSEGLMSHFASDARLFDLVNPLQATGADAGRKRAEEWLSSFQGPIGYQIQDLNIASGDDVAFCHSLNHVEATTRDGRKINIVVAGYRGLP